MFEMIFTVRFKRALTENSGVLFIRFRWWLEARGSSPPLVTHLNVIIIYCLLKRFASYALSIHSDIESSNGPGCWTGMIPCWFVHVSWWTSPIENLGQFIASCRLNKASFFQQDGHRVLGPGEAAWHLMS